MSVQKERDFTRLENPARSGLEVCLYAEFHPCGVCGCREIGTPARNGGEYDGKPAGVFDIVCPQCGHQRRLMFYEGRGYGSVLDRLPGHVGGPEPSAIIEPHEFAAGILYYGEHLAADRALWKLEVCVNELRKFMPEGANDIPMTAFRSETGRAAREQHPERFTRAFIDEHAAAAALLRLEAAGPPAAPVPLPPLGPPFGMIMVTRHLKWLAGWRHGQRFHALHVDATGEKLSRLDLTRAILEDTTLDHTDLSGASMREAELTGTRARDANLSSAVFIGATIARSIFTRSTMTQALLSGATITDSDFSDADFERSRWTMTKASQCTFARCVLRDTGFSRAVFTECDFRGADFGRGANTVNSAFETEFVRCDLRHTNWDGRALERVKFVDCKFAETHGQPTGTMVIERPDLSEAGDGSQIGTTRDVLVQWGIDPDAPVRPAAPVPAKPWVDRVQLAESVLLAALDRGATFEDTVAALMAAGFTREQSLEAMIDPSSVKLRPQG